MNEAAEELRDLAAQVADPNATLPDDWFTTVATALNDAASVIESSHPTLRAAEYFEGETRKLTADVAQLIDVLRRLVTAPQGISTVQFYANGKVQLILTPEGGDAFSEARALLEARCNP